MNESSKPRPYDLSIPGEFQRLVRESYGYLYTCRREHHGTDWEGRQFAIEALESIQSNELTYFPANPAKAAEAKAGRKA